MIGTNFALRGINFKILAVKLLLNGNNRPNFPFDKIGRDHHVFMRSKVIPQRIFTSRF